MRIGIVLMSIRILDSDRDQNDADPQHLSPLLFRNGVKITRLDPEEQP
jgi:hypothetical protein